MNRINFVLSGVEHGKFYNLGPVAENIDHMTQVHNSLIDSVIC